jgi:hypothetical protein
MQFLSVRSHGPVASRGEGKKPDRGQTARSTAIQGTVLYHVNQRVVYVGVLDTLARITACTGEWCLTIHQMRPLLRRLDSENDCITKATVESKV